MVTDGDAISVAARSPDVMGVWGGPCPSYQQDPEICQLGLVTADVALTITFDLDPHEVRSLAPTAPTTFGDFGPSGDLFVAGVDRTSLTTFVSRVTQTGDVVWSKPIGTEAPLALRVGSAVFVRTASSLSSLTTDGTVNWTVTLGQPVTTSALAVVPGGAIATLVAGGVDVRAAADGSDLWSATPHGGVEALAVDATGIIAVASGWVPGSPGSPGSILRYDSTGAPLPTWPIAANVPVTALAFDSTNALAVYQDWGEGSATLTRIDASGSTSFASTAPGQPLGMFVYSVFAGAAIGVDDSIVTAIPQFNDQGYSSPYYGLALADYSSSGAQAWMAEKTSDVWEVPFNNYELQDGVVATDLRCDGAGLCAVFGAHIGTQPWIELFQQ
jgi:hypothetical protein